MMETNENGSKRVLIVVHPAVNSEDSSRPTKWFVNEKSAIDYALEDDAFIYLFEDGTAYPITMGAKSGAAWGHSMAKAYLYSDLAMKKEGIIHMCNLDDTEASKAFLESLVDYVINCRSEQEAQS